MNNNNERIGSGILKSHNSQYNWYGNLKLREVNPEVVTIVALYRADNTHCLYKVLGRWIRLVDVL